MSGPPHFPVKGFAESSRLRKAIAVASELRATPGVLTHVGIQLAHQGQALQAVQWSCLRDADGAQAGWVGASASALTGLLDRWAALGEGHQVRLSEHADGMRFAAAALRAMEQSNAASLR